MVQMLFKLLSPRKRVFWIRFLILGAFIFLVGVWFKTEGEDGIHIDSKSARSESSQVIEPQPPHIEVPNHIEIRPNVVVPQPAQNELKKFEFPSNDEMADRLEFEKLFHSEEKNFVPQLGENGKGVRMTGAELQFAETIMKKEAFNLVLSDKIPYNRSVPDTRDFLCKKIDYDSDLPTATIIIIFTNEAWSALIRTVWSVINRSPKAFTKEIILVDDFSDREELGRKLDTYVKYHFPSNVRLLRLTQRHGLIKARLEGAKAAKGDILIFLDSHCEANVMWMEPLLQRIKENRRAVLVPIIEVIDDKTMEYYSGNGRYFQVGGFTWSGHFTWIDISSKEKKRRGGPVAPTRTPTMAGGLFAIDRNYFWEIGSYDEGMEVWGGENLEMSFRIWMCGGVLETIPCSHVGHIFRSFHPYTFPGNKDTHGLNTARMAEVWMDDYKRLFYLHRPELQTSDIGSVRDRKEFRANSQCKSFKWYLDNLLPDKFILDEDSIAYGRLRNKAFQNVELCLDTLQRNEKERYVIGFYGCHTYAAASQFISLSKSGELRREEMCASAVFSQETKRSPVIMTKCATGNNLQLWDLNKSGNLIHRPTGKCLDRGTLQAMDDAFVDFCNGSPSQQWWFDHYNVT